MLAHRHRTADDLPDLPDDGRRYEALDGQLVVTPPPAALHQEVVFRLQTQLRAQVTPAWRVLHEQVVRLGTDWRIPDIVVVRSHLPLSAHVYEPADVALVVEVVSGSTRRTDRLAKPAEYAAAGLERFWRVETEPDVALHAYELQAGAYRATLPSGPFPLVIDLPALQP